MQYPNAEDYYGYGEYDDEYEVYNDEENGDVSSSSVVVDLDDETAMNAREIEKQRAVTFETDDTFTSAPTDAEDDYGYVPLNLKKTERPSYEDRRYVIRGTFLSFIVFSNLKDFCLKIGAGQSVAVRRSIVPFAHNNILLVCGSVRMR